MQIGIECSECARITDDIRLGCLDTSTRIHRHFRWIKARFASKIGSRRAERLFHAVVAVIVGKVRNGSLEDSQRLPGFVVGVARGLFRDFIREIIHRQLQSSRRAKVGNCGKAAAGCAIRAEQNREFARVILRALCARDREALFRFYVKQQRPCDIQAEMGLTANEFRRIKSRAKARLSDLAHQRGTCQERLKPDSARSSH